MKSRCCCLWISLLVSAFVLADTGEELLNRAYRLEQTGRDLPPVLIHDLHRLAETSGVDVLLEDHYSLWLEWLEVAPYRLGNSQLFNEPLIAGTSANIRQVYHVGTDILTAGGFIVAKHWRYPVSFQTTNSTLPNFIRVSTNNPDVEIGALTMARTGIFGGLDNKLDLPFFPLRKGELKSGDEVIIEYQNLQLPSLASDNFTLPLFFRTDTGNAFFLAPVEPLQIHAGRVEKLDVQGPGRLNPGETFTAYVHLKDRYDNPAQGRAPALEVLVDGIFHSRLPSGDSNFHEIRGLVFESSGVHGIQVKSSGGGLSGRSNPLLVEYNNEKVFWVDTHPQNSLGEGETTPDNSTNFDLSITSVHDHYLTPTRWDLIDPPKAVLWGSDFRRGGNQLLVSEELPKSVGSQGELVRRISPEDTFAIALAEIPADDRLLNNQVTRLVELIAGTSHFEWYANRLLSKGYRLGFSASSHSHLLPVGKPVNAALTAVLSDAEEFWLEALSNGRTYVTTGNRLLLDVTVNDAGPGQRTVSSSRRIIKGRVTGTAPIHTVELIKNGDIIDEVNYASDDKSDTVKISFHSDSKPLHDQRDLPRNGREWIGFLQAREAGIISADAPGFRRPARQALILNPNIDNRLDFITWTRGNSSSFMVEFEGRNKDLVFELNLREGREDIDVTPILRPSSKIPGSRQMISMYDLRQGRIIRALSVDGYEDQISFELVDPDSEVDVGFEFTDETGGREGDYYYVRISQLDDHVAWSSPVFVGGFDHP